VFSGWEIAESGKDAGREKPHVAQLHTAKKKRKRTETGRQEWRLQFALAFRCVLVLVQSPPTSFSHFPFSVFHAQWGYF